MFSNHVEVVVPAGHPRRELAEEATLHNSREGREQRPDGSLVLRFQGPNVCPDHLVRDWWLREVPQPTAAR